MTKNKKLAKVSTRKDGKVKKVLKTIFTPLFAIGRYLKGSWSELKQVQWPNRRSTWGMTAAVILFTALFVALIVSLDAIFNQLFKLIIK